MSALMGGIERPFSRLSDRVGQLGVAKIRAFQASPESQTFVAPVNATYTFRAWSGGRSTDTRIGGGSGSFSKITIPMLAGSVATLSVGSGFHPSSRVTSHNVAAATTITLPGGIVVNCPVDGMPTGGDTNVASVNPTSLDTNGGAAPGDEAYPGGRGGAFYSGSGNVALLGGPGQTPGGGAGGVRNTLSGGQVGYASAGDGLVLASWVEDAP